MFEFGEDFWPVRTQTVEQFEKNGAVFKGAVQALSEEGNNGVRGIPQQERVSVMPGKTLDRDHSACGIGKIVVGQMGHQAQRVRETSLEETADLRLIIESSKAVRAFEWKKEDARKSAIDIRQRDQHVVATWPDMQRVSFKLMFAVWTGRDGQFLVAIVEILLRKIETR